ncbi:hypothetical protein D0T50_01820 [Bacteroides sp. 214]|nr:hypothetical protein [Bacteroides sp. 214]
MTKTRNPISSLLLFVGVIVALSVVCITTPELSPNDTTGQLLWLGRGCIVFGVCGVLSAIVRTPSNESNFAGIVSWVLICLGSVQAVWGLCQLYGLTYSNHSLFALTGSFFNPGPYSGYLAMVLPICLHQWLLLRSKEQRTLFEQIGYYLAFVSMILILCVLPAGMSRSAWLAALVSCGMVYAIHYSLIDFIKKQWRTHRKRMIGCFAAAILLAILSTVWVFYIKKDSANGRLFMWKITATAIFEKPFGYGTNSFAAVYGATQEVYFAKGNYSEQEEHVAGSPEYAFNEYLQVALEQGIPVLVVLLLLIGYCLFVSLKNKRVGVAAAVVSLLVFAFSSYPFQLPVFVCTFVFLLAACVLGRSNYWLGLFSLCMAITGFVIEQNNTYEEHCKWRSSRMLYQTGAYDSAIKAYSELYPVLKTHPAFLFEYGHAYHKAGQYAQSTKIMKEAVQYSCDPMILNIIGKNYQELAQYHEAEQWLLRAVNRLPGRIYPYYLLAKLYAEPEFHQPKKLEEMVQLVLTKEPKVQSTAVRQMREEVRKLASKGKEQNKY